MYSYCEKEFVGWNFRKRRILEEVVSYMPDVICFQELEFQAFRVKIFFLVFKFMVFCFFS